MYHLKVLVPLGMELNEILFDIIMSFNIAGHSIQILTNPQAQYQSCIICISSRMSHGMFNFMRNCNYTCSIDKDPAPVLEVSEVEFTKEISL